MRKFIFFVSCAMLCSTMVSAEVNVSVDDYIKVIAINGQEVQNNPFSPNKRNFTLEAGRHVITARYDRLFDLTSGRHDYLKSGNVTLSVEVQDSQTYQLVMPNQPSNYSAAKEYAKSPILALSQNGKILFQETQSEKSEGILSSLSGLFGRDKQAIQSNQKAVAAISSNPSNTTSSALPVSNLDAQKVEAAKVITDTNIKPVAVKSDNTLDKFMQIWLNASEAEREKIRQWVSK